MRERAPTSGVLEGLLGQLQAGIRRVWWQAVQQRLPPQLLRKALDRAFLKDGHDRAATQPRSHAQRAVNILPRIGLVEKVVGVRRAQQLLAATLLARGGLLRRGHPVRDGPPERGLYALPQVKRKGAVQQRLVESRAPPARPLLRPLACQMWVEPFESVDGRSGRLQHQKAAVEACMRQG